MDSIIEYVGVHVSRSCAHMIIEYAYTIDDMIKFWIDGLPMHLYPGMIMHNHVHVFRFSSQRIGTGPNCYQEYIQWSGHVWDPHKHEISMNSDRLAFEFDRIPPNYYYYIRLMKWVPTCALHQEGWSPIWCSYIHIDILTEFCTSNAHTNEDPVLCGCKYSNAVETRLDEYLKTDQWFTTHYLYYAMRRGILLDRPTQKSESASSY